LASEVQQKKFHFPMQAGEQVIQALRRHWLHVTMSEIWMAIVLIVPIVLLWLILGWIGVRDDDIGRWIGIGLTVLWGGYWLFKMFMAWYAYHNDLWVITNQRLVDVRKPTPLRLEMSSADMADVLDMSVVRRGLLPTIFNYGDVRCQTAGSSALFVLEGVRNPSDVQALIDKTRDEARMMQGGRRGNYPAQWGDAAPATPAPPPAAAPAAPQPAAASQPPPAQAAPAQAAAPPPTSPEVSPNPPDSPPPAS
jgi:hypothetical protein